MQTSKTHLPGDRVLSNLSPRGQKTISESELSTIVNSAFRTQSARLQSTGTSSVSSIPRDICWVRGPATPPPSTPSLSTTVYTNPFPFSSPSTTTQMNINYTGAARYTQTWSVPTTRYGGCGTRETDNMLRDRRMVYIKTESSRLLHFLMQYARTSIFSDA